MLRKWFDQSIFYALGRSNFLTSERRVEMFKNVYNCCTQRHPLRHSTKADYRSASKNTFFSVLLFADKLSGCACEVVGSDACCLDTTHGME